MPSASPMSAGPLSVVMIAVLALAVWFDVRERRIPNWLTAGGLIGSLALRGLLGPDVLVQGVLGGATGFSIGILLFATGAMGAGDGKLLTTVGAILGLETFLLCVPLIGVFGGLIALGMTLRNGTIIPTLLRVRELMFYVVSFGRIGSRRTLVMQGGVTVPYGVAVAMGAVMAWLAWGMTP